MASPPSIIELVEHFARNADSYRESLNETELRVQFIDPFFEALGWDIHNRQHYAETYKDVIHEYSLKSGLHTEAPDYCFQVGGTRKFFVEAKRPAINVASDPASAFQLRSYAWTSKLPLSLLTNFAQLAVYDCRLEPRAKDSASVARVDLIPFDQYPERWDDIASRFSKEAVYQGSFDRYIESSKLKRGTAEVDDAFLTEIQNWRKALASDIASRNLSLSQREVNFAVQQTIDRIVFLRICEDRGIEVYGQLQGLQQGNHIYRRLLTIYERADEKYNSGLFHFTDEPDRAETPDTLTPKLRIDDSCLRAILKRLYYPESPYRFSHFPAEILGQVYEQFLGQVITLTASHQARIKPRPELKKAHGVYYTPTYIVDFIVQETLGRLVEGKTPKRVSNLRVLDPACGSGSFLLGACQFLLNWHRDWYLADGSDKNRKVLYRTHGGEWQLTMAEKKRILLNNIFGVDIDPQAVEVTKLSLLLKVMEGENDQTLGASLRLFHERALPDLGNNVKCGNSLVGSDFYQYEKLLRLDEEDRYRINPFEWDGPEGFQQIMGVGGFDVVIGNPPYSYRKATQDKLRPYYVAKYKSAEGNFELYKFFIERNLELCRDSGLVGMIVSATFLVQPTFAKLRRILLANELVTLAPLGPNVFEGATVDTTIIVAKKHQPEESSELQVMTPQSPLDLPRTVAYPIRQERFSSNPGAVFDYKLAERAAEIVQRLLESFPPIEHGYEFGVGINTGYIREELVANHRIDARYHRMVPGSGISRYGPVETDGWIMFDPQFVQRMGKLGRTLPAEHLLSSEKILVVRTRNLSLKRRIVATIDASGAYNLNRLSNIVARSGYSLAGLLGILNSELFQWLFSTRFFDYEIKPVYLRSAPLADSNDSELVAMVNEMIQLHERIALARTTHESTALQRQIEVADRNIDRVVYRLYGLAENEISIVESLRSP
jgi:Eco57I restriction-modification methylase/TaqI-like C-terminal specificity domain